jgi:hypothetical protein
MTKKDEGGRKELNQSDSGLKVTDRRLFNTDGRLREDIPDEPDEAEPISPPGDPVEKPVVVSDPGFEHRPVEEPEGVDFTMLINAMAQPALLFLGEIPRPGSNEGEVELEQARLQIDMIELLRVKCRGNLNPDEEGLLDRVLYQLRMLYVARSGQPGSTG